MNTAAATQVGVKHLDHLNMTVTDLAESLDWYRRVLDFEKVEDGLYQGHPWAIIRSGDAMLCLYERPDFKRADKPERLRRKAHELSHFALRITEPEAWAARVEDQKLTQVFDTVHWPHSTAWYICDPTGYTIEIAAWKNDRVQF
jgi:catechol 2,3-dioxygenase-like lactoylglutathione lyase family enzyme